MKKTVSKDEQELQTSVYWASQSEDRLISLCGWDINNIHYSYQVEKITKAEFDRRVARSLTRDTVLIRNMKKRPISTEERLIKIVESLSYSQRIALLKIIDRDPSFPPLARQTGE